MRRPRAEPLTLTNSSPSSSQQPPQPQQGSRTQAQDTRAPRYHINHFDTGGMPVSLWGMDRRDVWKTCFCFHVRTVTIFIGVWYLMMYILALSFHAALLMYEPGQEGYGGMTVRPEPMLPTPVSKIMPEPKPAEIPKPESLTIDYRARPQSEDQRASQSEYHRTSRVDTMRNGPLTFVLDTSRKATSQVILLTVCNMLITLLMVYGAVRGKPSYLMPFFVLRVFDFCIFCLTMVGYFSYLPNVTEGIMNTQGLPFRDEFLRMDPQLLSFITLIFIVAFIAVKAYIIGVIWNCYKYLMLRNTVIRGVIAYRHDDPTSIMGLQQNLLPDLPDYETAVNDPRYAKKPPSDSTGPSHSAVVPSAVGHVPIGSNTIAMPPPPPYSVAVASEPLHLVMPLQQQNNSTASVVPQSLPLPSPEVTQGNNNNLDKEEHHPHQESSPVFVSVLPQQMEVDIATITAEAPAPATTGPDSASAPTSAIVNEMISHTHHHQLHHHQ